MGGDCKLQVLEPEEVDLVAAQIEKENAEEVVCYIFYSIGVLVFNTWTKQAEKKMKRGVKAGEE